MKQLYIIVIGLISLFAYSCVKDNGSYGDPEPAVAVTGLKDSTYEVYTHRDTLRISPNVANESRYDFFWTAYSRNFTQGTGVVPKPDTLGRTKDLNYEVLLNPGQYFLVFNVRDKKTAVTNMITRDLVVSTLTMNGWYLLKDDGNTTDFDFINPQGRIDNWMAFYNNGQSLPGRAIKAVFSPSFKLTPTATDLFNAFAVITDRDAAVFRIDNGKLVMSFDNMFFQKPEVKRPQNILQPVGTNSLCLVNNNKAYWLIKGALFANSSASSYSISEIASVGATPILFDKNSKSVLVIDNGNYVALGSSGAALKNMNANLIWMAGYAGSRSIALALFRQNDGSGLLVKMNAGTGYLLYNSSPLVLISKTLPQDNGLMSADVIAGNHDADYIYYAKGNEIYLTDLSSLQQSLQVTLPAGENVTCIQHIKYPQPGTGVSTYTTNYLAIASYSNGHYKVYLHPISSTGTIQPLSKPDFEGLGRVSCVNYMEKGLGSRVF